MFGFHSAALSRVQVKYLLRVYACTSEYYDSVFIHPFLSVAAGLCTCEQTKFFIIHCVTTACKALLILHVLGTSKLWLYETLWQRYSEKQETELQANDSWVGGSLLDINTPDANIPIKADDGVLLCTYAVGKVDCRAI